VIASGRVEARRGGHPLNELGDGEVFGEMAVLDPGPRSATVTSLEPTHLLVLDQAPLHDLLIEQPQIALGIISVLVRHLRDRVSDLETSRSRSG
jgi:CRP-like cAMP-binding protein